MKIEYEITVEDMVEARLGRFSPASHYLIVVAAMVIGAAAICKLLYAACI